MADSVSEERAEPSAASDLEAWRGDSGSIAASGVAVITSKILSVRRGRRCQLVAKNVAGGEDFPRWLVRDDEALVVALKREKATGVNAG
jgi:hypothetical protein